MAPKLQLAMAASLNAKGIEFRKRIVAVLCNLGMHNSQAELAVGKKFANIAWLTDVQLASINNELHEAESEKWSPSFLLGVLNTKFNKYKKEYMQAVYINHYSVKYPTLSTGKNFIASLAITEEMLDDDFVHQKKLESYQNHVKKLDDKAGFTDVHITSIQPNTVYGPQGFRFDRVRAMEIALIALLLERKDNKIVIDAETYESIQHVIVDTENFNDNTITLRIE